MNYACVGIAGMAMGIAVGIIVSRDAAHMDDHMIDHCRKVVAAVSDFDDETVDRREKWQAECPQLRTEWEIIQAVAAVKKSSER